MAQLVGDEKADVAVTNQPGALRPGEESDKKPAKWGDIYTCNTMIEKNNSELKVQVQNKRTKQLFKGIYTIDKLVDCGFNKQQQTLQDIQNILESAFNNDDGLTLNIS